MTNPALESVCQKIKLQQYHHHILLCTGPNCCTPEEGTVAWDHLKAKLKETGLIDGQINRTKVGCLRICQQGPVAVVYPEGTWYHSVTPDICDKIIEQHCLAMQPVEENIFAQNTLQSS